jgi:hypothetical protein
LSFRCKREAKKNGKEENNFTHTISFSELKVKCLTVRES